MHAMPLFPLGRCVITQGAADALKAHPACEPFELLNRHQHGDWGHVQAEDIESNDEAITLGKRILSAYAIDPDKPCKGYGPNTLWIITEADRSVTTILLPQEY